MQPSITGPIWSIAKLNEENAGRKEVEWNHETNLKIAFVCNNTRLMKWASHFNLLVWITLTVVFTSVPWLSLLFTAGVNSSISCQPGGTSPGYWAVTSSRSYCGSGEGGEVFVKYCVVELRKYWTVYIVIPLHKMKWTNLLELSPPNQFVWWLIHH